MRIRFGSLLLVPLAIFAAETPAPPRAKPLHMGYVNGILESHNSNKLSVRGSHDLLFEFTVDRRTWIERNRERIRASELVTGDRVEVVSDRPSTAEPAPYARMVQVLSPAPFQQPIVSRGNYSFRQPEPNLLTAENRLILTGVVISRLGSRLELKTRLDGIKIIYLRRDTMFLRDGYQVNESALVTNSHVFIKAGRNRDDELEAYQIVWGGILDPTASQ